MPKITLFTQPDSLPCEAVKLFLKDRGAKFDELDVSRDETALRELKDKYKSRSTPTLVIDERVLVGFDPERIDEMLGRAPKRSLRLGLPR
jgi:glutaredoxin